MLNSIQHIIKCEKINFVELLELGGQYHWNLQFVLNFRNIMFNSFKSSLNKFDSPPFCSTKNPVKIDFTGFFISNN